MEIVLAGLEHLEEVSRLFDQFRIFYQQPSNLEAARRFLQERFQNNDSTIFLAGNKGGHMVGFTQLYPSFSSVSMKRTWILNDLFVESAWRNKGIANLLMSAAEEYAQKTGAIRIVLATQISNLSAQSLYQSRGYTKDEEFYHYGLRF